MLAPRTWKIIGLFATLVLPLCFGLFHFQFFKDPVINAAVKDSFFWIIFIGLYFIVRFGEQESFADLGFKHNFFNSLGIAFITLLSIYVVLMFFGISYLLITKSKPPHELLMEKIGHLPAWFKMILAFRAGVVEETFFRAYAITRLLELTRSHFIAISVPLLIFAAGHIAYGTVYHFLAAFLIGAVLTFSYVKTKNLLANIISHTLFDAIALLLISVVKV